MREPKYRVWDKINKEMVAVIDLTWKDGVLIEIDTETYVHFPQEKDTCELMQYIGAKDKNSKEIYAGDITKDNHGISRIDVRVFDCDKVCQVYEGNPEPDLLHEYNGCWLFGYFSLVKYIEVIGTIHENPELLKGKGE